MKKKKHEEASYRVSDFTAEVSKEVKFFECKGEFLITSATFANKNPWVAGACPGFLTGGLHRWYIKDTGVCPQTLTNFLHLLCHLVAYFN